MNNRKYNIRGILKEVKRRKKHERRISNLINKLCIDDLKCCDIYTTTDGIRPMRVRRYDIHIKEDNKLW